MEKQLMVSESFIDNFFLEIITAKKNLKTTQELEEKKNMEKLDEIKDDLITLEDEAEQIQALDEKILQVPTPAIAPKIQKTIQSIALPQAPSFHKIHVPVPQQKNQDFIDIGKLNELISDPETTLIQCDGPNKQIIINKKNKQIKTNIHLNEQEINTIIQKFSFRAGQPITEPLFKAEISHLAITAVISEFSKRFILVRK